MKKGKGMFSFKTPISIGLVSLLVLGCEINSSDTKIQYMPDMADSPTVKAQEGYLEPPEHSFPVSGMIYPKTLEEAENVLQNMLPATAQVVEEGKKHYMTFCVPCHGPDAKGKHSLGAGYPPPPDLTNAAYKDRKSGFYFYKITFGGPLMPGYGYATDPRERWAIARYLESLHAE